MFLTVEQKEKNAVKSLISMDVWQFKRAGMSEKDATSKALAKNNTEIQLYKRQAKKAYRTSIYTTLDDNDFYAGMKAFAAPFKNLQPIYSNAASFYGKARTVNNGETINLISYSSCVLSYNRRKNTLLQNGLTKPSATTRKHVAEFLDQLFGEYGGSIVYRRLD